MKKNAIIGIIGAAAVGAGAYFLLRNKSALKNDAVSSANSGTTTIVGTGDTSVIPSKIVITGERNPLAAIELIYNAEITGGNNYTITWEAFGGTITKSSGKQVFVKWDSTGRTKLIATVKSADGTTLKGEFSVTESWQLNIDLSGIPLGNGSL